MGTPPLKSLVSAHSTLRAPFPPRSAAHRRSAIRWPDRAERRYAGRGTRRQQMRDGPAVCGTGLRLVRWAQLLGLHAIWGSHPETPRRRTPSPQQTQRATPVRGSHDGPLEPNGPRATPASTSPALSAALPQPTQRTAGPRSAGRIERSDGTRVRDTWDMWTNPLYAIPG